MAKMRLTFDGLERLARRIDEIDGDLQQAADEALTKVQSHIQGNTRQAAAKYAKGGTKYSTGRMMATVKANEGPEWAGSVASVHVGFNLYEPGGFHSIFIMYGTPRIAKDSNLYNAIRGAKTQKQVREIMEKVFTEHARL